MNTTSLVTLQRRLDRAEAFFWFLDRFSSMNFAVIAEGRGALNNAALQAALAAAQHRHPLLSVAIEADAEQRPCFAPRPQQGIPLERLQSSDDHWRAALAERIVIPFALGDAPLVRAYRFGCADDRWVIALVLHHSVADARSGFSLLNEVLLNTAGVAVPAEAIAPRPTLIELYPPAFVDDAGRELGGQLKAARKAASERSGPLETQARHQAATGPLQPRIITLTLEAPLSKTLASRARDAGTTINGVIGAAQLIALRRLFGDNAERVLGLTCAADLRPYLSAPMDALTPGFYVTLITSIQRVGDADGLWKLAQRLTGSIRQQISVGAAHLLYDFLPPADQFPATDAGIAMFCGLMARGPQTSLLSNAGLLAPLPALPGLSVDARSFALCPTATQPVFTAVTTDAGRMTIHLNYNAAQLPDDAAAEVAASLDALLRDAATFL
jgi:NRPS condensation-like uncharacterized protein